MSTATSTQIWVTSGHYHKCWLIMDYSMSGSTMTYTVKLHFDGGCAQFRNIYVKVGGTTVASGGAHAYQSGYTNTSHEATIFSGYTTTISGSQTVTFGGEKYVNSSTWESTTGSFSVSGVSAPSGLGCTVNSVAWNGVNGTFSVSNWGGEPTGSSKYIAGRLFGASGSARREETGTNTNSITKTITTSSTPLDGGIDVKGAGNYRIDTYASNSVGSSTTSMQNVYTPPAPLQTLSYSQTQQSTNVKVDVSITGGNSTNNYGNTVTTYWRYSTNGGSSWSGWGNAGTGTPWTTKTASFTCAYGASVKIEAYQSYQSKDSDHKTVSFTATNGTAPSGGTLSVSSSTWNSITLAASGVSYGKPDGISGRKLAIGVHAYNDNTTKRENQVENVTSATTTVNNSSVYPSGTALQLKGMLAVYPYIWAWNTIQSTYVVNQTTAYYLPPAPGQLSYTLDSETVTQKTFTVSYVGVGANNVTDYTAADLKRTVRYSEDNGTTWTYVDNDVQKSLTTTTSFQITVAAQHNVIVQSWLSYKGKNSDVSAVVISNNADPIYFYGSVSERDPVTGEFSDPESRLITKFYGSVNDETVKITKLYGSVNGVAREFFEDV